MRQLAFVPLLPLTLSAVSGPARPADAEPALRPASVAAAATNAHAQPEILVRRHLVPPPRLLAVEDPAAALEANNEVHAPQEEHDPPAVEATLGLDRPARRVIQQRLLSQGFDPGAPDGLFGPRTRAAIRRWQEARGEPPTGYLTAADIEALRGGAPPGPARPGPAAAAPTAAEPPATASAMRQDCEQWNTEEFFETATSATVTACLAAGANVAARDDDLNTPLHWAASRSNAPAVIDALLAAGAELEARNREYELTPLHRAAADNENPTVLQTLLAAGADLEASTNQGWGPLHHAAESNSNPAVTESLLAAGAELEVPTNLGYTSLHLAVAGNGNPAVTETLLAAGANLEKRANDGRTALHFAAGFNENPAVIESLLAAGADIRASTDDGRTALHRAAANDNPAVVEALLAAGANEAARDEEGFTPLHELAFRPLPDDAARLTQRLALVRTLASARGAEAVDGRGRTALAVAAETGRNGPVVKALLDAGADPTALPDDALPLQWAYTDRVDLSVVDALLAAGVDVSARRRDTGETALHQAHDPVVLQRLLAAGAEVMARDNLGNTPLHLPFSSSRFRAGEAIEALIAAGADVMARNDDGETPLHGAGSRVAAEALITAGADVTARDNAGNTPLHRAGRGAVEALVAAGADVTARNNAGETPLHEQSAPAAVEALIAAGADVMARNNAGETPLHEQSASRRD